MPTEAQWEKAARGTDGCIYPWGNEWGRSKANVEDNLIIGFVKTFGIYTTPVGEYSPRGDSPYGVADMSGNVWEWCQSKYKPYPYRVDDGREIIDESSDSRVVHGGSFYYDAWYARCAFRYRFSSFDWYWNYGFRVCAAPV